MIALNPDPGLMFFLLFGNRSAVCSSRSERGKKRVLFLQSIEFSLETVHTTLLSGPKSKICPNWLE